MNVKNDIYLTLLKKNLKFIMLKIKKEISTNANIVIIGLMQQIIASSVLEITYNKSFANGLLVLKALTKLFRKFKEIRWAHI